MDLVHIKFLRRLIVDGPCRRTSSTVAEHFQSVHRLGVRHGRQFDYSAEDIAHARDILRSRGIPESEPDTVSEAFDRAAASMTPGISEKSGSLSPYHDMVAVRAMTPGCRFMGHLMPAELHGFTVMYSSDAMAIETEAILVIENLETMRQLHRYRWIFDSEVARSAVLAVYRGDNVFKVHHAARLVEERTEPVWSFPDPDPAGIGLASKLPRLAGLLLPWERLEEMLRLKRRDDLYHPHLQSWSAILDACPQPDVYRAWTILQKTQYGLNQEALRDLVNSPFN